jgi:hypothetical protein
MVAPTWQMQMAKGNDGAFQENGAGPGGVAGRVYRVHWRLFEGAQRRIKSLTFRVVSASVLAQDRAGAVSRPPEMEDIACRATPRSLTAPR